MDRASIEARVKELFAEQLAVDAAQVTPEARFSEDLNADSLDLVEMIMEMEEETFIKQSQAIAQKLFDIMYSNIDIPSADLMAVR